MIFATTANNAAPLSTAYNFTSIIVAIAFIIAAGAFIAAYSYVQFKTKKGELIDKKDDKEDKIADRTVKLYQEQVDALELN
jgi:hypothetical protein